MKLTLKKAQEMMDKNGGFLDLSGTQITNSCNYKQLSNGDYVEA